MKLKNKKGGVVTSTVVGVGALIVGIIITLVIINTMIDAELLGTRDTATLTVINETPSWINDSGYTLNEVNSSNSNYVITALWNETTDVIILPANYTVNSVGVLSNITTNDYSTNDYLLNVSYTFLHTAPYSDNVNTVGNMSTNFTSGIRNISNKIPTILLLVAVVFLFGALVLLVRQSQAMGLVNSGGSL